MNTSASKLGRPAWTSRWKLGWIVLWRIVVFNFWFGIFSLPATITAKLFSTIPVNHMKPEIGGFITFIVGIINIPLALYYAASETGFFRKYGEESKNTLQ